MKRCTILCAISVIMFAICGCTENNQTPEEIGPTTICGTTELLSFIDGMNLSNTKSGEVSVDDVLDVIAPLYPVAIEYLLKNDYNYLEDFNEGDPNIIMTALAIAEYDIIQSRVVTKGQVTDVLECILLGEGIGTLSGLGTKQLAKYVAKKILSRAVPYVGTATAVVSAALCIADL